jgi:hypothetical protein
MATCEAVGTATRTSSHVKVVIAEIRDISERPRRFLSAGVKRPVGPFIRTAPNRARAAHHVFLACVQISQKFDSQHI